MIWLEVSKDVIYKMALFASYGLEAKVKQWTDSFLEFKLYNRLHLTILYNIFYELAMYTRKTTRLTLNKQWSMIQKMILIHSEFIIVYDS